MVRCECTCTSLKETAFYNLVLGHRKQSSAKFAIIKMYLHLPGGRSRMSKKEAWNRLHQLLDSVTPSDRFRDILTSIYLLLSLGYIIILLIFGLLS